MLGMNIGVDIGTTNTRFYIEGKGVVSADNTATAVKTSRTGKSVVIGSAAYQMIGREPDSIQVHRPLIDGIVSDFSSAQILLRSNLEKLCGNQILKPNVLICMPTNATGLEKRTLLDIGIASGAAHACLIERPLAAALGAGIDYNKPRGNMVVDIGAGTTEIAVITMGSIAISDSIRVAGNSFDEAIARFIRNERDILVGKLTVEQIKKKIGCAYMREAEIAILAKGKSYLSGMPTLFEISTTDVFLAIREQLLQITDAIHSLLSDTPPELAGDIYENGIVLTGGSALLYGMAKCIETRTGVKTRVAEEPENCTAKGIGIALQHPEILTNNGYYFKTRDDIFPGTYSGITST